MERRTKAEITTNEERWARQQIRWYSGAWRAKERSEEEEKRGSQLAKKKKKPTSKTPSLECGFNLFIFSQNDVLEKNLKNKSTT